MKELIGALIRKARNEHHYSQEALCHGICAVSYLSKIELGQVNPSSDIVSLLMERLGLSASQDEILLLKAKDVIDACWNSIYEIRFEKCAKQFDLLKEDLSALQYSKYMIDIALLELLLKVFYNHDIQTIHYSELEQYTSYMTNRQYSAFFIVKGYLEEDLSQFDYAIRIDPNATHFYFYGMYLMEKGFYIKSIVQFQRSYDEAIRDSKLILAMHSKFSMAMTYANLDEESFMYEGFMQAMAYAKALGEEELCKSAYYNIGATYLDHGKIEEAYEYLMKGYNGDFLYDHKLAICLEQMHRKEEAYAYLQHGFQQEYLNEEDVLMLETVKYRLDHELYLEDIEYRNQVKHLFQLIKNNKPRGFLLFHLRYMLEVLEYERKYKEAYQLLKEFSLK